MRTKISLVWDERKGFLPLLKTMLLYYDRVNITLPMFERNMPYYTEKWNALIEEIHKKYPQYPHFRWRSKKNGMDKLTFDYASIWSGLPQGTTTASAISYFGKDIDSESIDELMEKPYVREFADSCTPGPDENLSPIEAWGVHEMMAYSSNWLVYYENQIGKIIEFLYKGENTASLLYDIRYIYDEIGAKPSWRSAITASHKILLPYYDLPLTELIHLRKRMAEKYDTKLPSFMSGFYPTGSTQMESLTEFVENKINPEIKDFNESLSKNPYMKALRKIFAEPTGYAKLEPTYFTGIDLHAKYVWREEIDKTQKDIQNGAEPWIRYANLPTYLCKMIDHPYPFEHRKKSPIHYRVEF